MQKLHCLRFCLHLQCLSLYVYVTWGYLIKGTLLLLISFGTLDVNANNPHVLRPVPNQWYIDSSLYRHGVTNIKSDKVFKLKLSPLTSVGV